MKRKISLLLTLAAWSLSNVRAAAELSVTDLRCEYCKNPPAVDVLAPRLSWKLSSSKRAQSQSAYRIVVASSAELLKPGTADLWDSGKVDSDRSIQLPYAGKKLTAQQSCFWQVQVWDQDGCASDWSPPAEWQMGLLNDADWLDAEWIRLSEDSRHSPLTQRPLQIHQMTKPRMVEAFPAPLFRREFSVHSAVKQARAYICGLGYNELYVNGRRCGDAMLEPGQTTYDVRAFYVTRDVTKFLQRGTNAIGIMLGNGFFGQNHAFNAGGLANGQPVLRAKIVVNYVNGNTQTIASDESWTAGTGPVMYDNVYGGETYDARQEVAGWSKPGFTNSFWSPATKAMMPSTALQAEMIPPIRRLEEIPPRRVWSGENGKWIFDLGQNIAGWARIHLRAPAGTQIKLQFAERLAPNKQALDFTTTGVSATGLIQTDVYVCKGGGTETWEPRFTYHGFRYVSVEGLPEKPGQDFLTGVLAHTDVVRNGTFECADETLNRIYQTSLWTIEDNLHGTAEDCPHREKCGWLGDAHADAETEIYNFDMAMFWTKFVDDIQTVLGRGGRTYWGQKATPGIPCNIAVGRRLCEEARPDWGAAYVLLPWYLYNYYDDTEVFTRHYPHLKDWIEYVKSLREDGIVTRGYGDWCPPGGNSNMECPVPLTSTAYFYGTLRIMQQFAGVLGKTSDAADFSRLADETKTAFNLKFFNTSTHGYGSQTADAVVLRFDLAPDGQAAAVAAALAKEISVRHGGHAFVGIHGGRPLFTQLCNYGKDDVAIAAMKQGTWPSYAYALAHGATTWPEQFNEMKIANPLGDFSLNHPMQSGFAAWFHESVAGIRPAAPGFKKIEMIPHGFNQIAWAKAEHESPYGTIVSDWQNQHGNFAWKISIPANSSATVYIPTQDAGSVTENGHPIEKSPGVKLLRFENGQAVFEVASGNYHFRSRL
jgi:alpha-L-rhamnosidase